MNKEEAIRKLVEEDGFFKHNNYEVVEATEEACILKEPILDKSNIFWGIICPYAIVKKISKSICFNCSYILDIFSGWNILMLYFF